MKDKGRRLSIPLWDAPCIPLLADIIKDLNECLVYTMTRSGQSIENSLLYLSQTGVVAFTHPGGMKNLDGPRRIHWNMILIWGACACRCFLQLRYTRPWKRTHEWTIIVRSKLELRAFQEHPAWTSCFRPSKISCAVITPEEFHERGCQLSLRFSVSIDVIYPELVKRGVAVSLLVFLTKHNFTSMH